MVRFVSIALRAAEFELNTAIVDFDRLRVSKYPIF